MNYFEAIVLGLVQGLTEFLPVSSSGHLVIAESLMDVPTPGVFVEVALHLATLLSVLIVYHRRIASIAVGAVRLEPESWRYIGLLLLASVPAGIVGVFFKDQVEAAFDTPWVTGIALLVTGVLLWSTRIMGERNWTEQPGRRNAIGMGIAQAFAILPGISRSGSTITAGLWGHLQGDRAAEFSFLMSVIAISGAVVLQLGEVGESMGQVGGAPLAVAFISALVSGVLAIRLLVWLLRKQTFYVFAYYLWITGGLFLIFLGLRG
ncbi:MAG TPA: undecaprenyl-diphosphate phosphatase [Longimicrobiales bacterium]